MPEVKAFSQAPEDKNLDENLENLRNELLELKEGNDDTEKSINALGENIEENQGEILRSIGTMALYLQQNFENLPAEKKEKASKVLEKVFALQNVIQTEVKSEFLSKDTKEIITSTINKKEQLLASCSKLEKDEKGILWSTVNFPTAEMQERIGMGNMLPSSVQFVEVQTKDGKIFYGYRNETSFKGVKRDGFVDITTGQYIPIVNGDKFRSISQIPADAKGDYAEYKKKGYKFPTDESIKTLDESYLINLKQEDELKEKFSGDSVEIKNGDISKKIESMGSNIENLEEKAQKLKDSISESQIPLSVAKAMIIASEKLNVPLSSIISLLSVESNFNIMARSPSGDHYGLTQMGKGATQSALEYIGVSKEVSETLYSSGEIYNPMLNVFLGTIYCFKKSGSKDVATAYLYHNQGPQGASRILAKYNGDTSKIQDSDMIGQNPWSKIYPKLQNIKAKYSHLDTLV